MNEEEQKKLKQQVMDKAAGDVGMLTTEFLANGLMVLDPSAKNGCRVTPKGAMFVNVALSINSIFEMGTMVNEAAMEAVKRIRAGEAATDETFSRILSTFAEGVAAFRKDK